MTLLFFSVGMEEGALNCLRTLSPVVEYCEWLSVVKNPALISSRNPLIATYKSRMSGNSLHP